MLIRSSRRAGFSLTEALIAIFCVAIGLMGILVLFPIGALQMAQSIKDDRSAQANHHGSTRMRQFWRDEVFKPPVPRYSPFTFQYRDPYVDAMLDVNAPYTNPPYAPTYVTAGNTANASIVQSSIYQGNLAPLPYYLSTPSYPVFLDPVGWQNPVNALGAQKFWVGGFLNSIPRRSLMGVQAGVTSPGFISLQGLCVQTDDQAFGRDGTPDTLDNQRDTSNSLGGFVPLTTSFNASYNVQYDGRYNWAFLLRRPKCINWDQADLSVVVYSGRSLDGLSNENGYAGSTFTQGSTEVVMPYPGSRPNIRRGSWILDGTMLNPYKPNPSYAPSPPYAAGAPEPHGYFYRVVNVNDDNPGVLILEIQNPAQASTVTNGAPYGVAITMEHVVEVFERKTLTKVIVPVP